MLQAMHASNARKQCRYERTDGRTYGEPWLRTREIVTFRNARAHIRRFPRADFKDKR